MSVQLQSRDEIPAKYKWDMSHIYADEDAWDAAISALQKKIDMAATFAGKLNQSADILADYLNLEQQIWPELRRLGSYARLQISVDTNNQTAVAMSGRMTSFGASMVATLAFAVPEILEIDPALIQQRLQESEKLAPYGHFLERIEKHRPHMRSAEVEALLGLASDTLSSATAAHSTLANGELPFPPAVDSEGQEHPVAQGSIRGLLASPDRTLRRSAYESYADTHLAFKKTMANVLSTGIKRNVLMSRIRNYDNALHASLKSDHIPAGVFHSLLETFQKNLPTWHRYWEIRRKALKIDKIYEYDTRAPLSLNPPEVTYEEAVDMISEGMAPLGEEYVAVMRAGSLEGNWVDAMPNRGKRMGAFSAGIPGAHPFIMMSFTPNLFGMSTLAHELGHAMHSHLTWQVQDIPAYTAYGLFAAEVASNFNQAMTRAHLFETQPDREYQIAIIEEAMANFHRYFFIMPTLARFEKAIHERVEGSRSLTASYMNGLMADLFREGYGDHFEMDDDHVGITWAEFHTHMYSNFYVYKYATGIAGAHALADQVRSGQDGAVERYLNFLKEGGSDYPINILRRAGVDMETPEPVEKGFEVLASHVDRLEKLIAEREG